jgi:hypothetical protein
MAGSKKDGELGEKTSASRLPLRSPSRTPTTRERGRSVVRRGGNEIVVHERVIRDAGGSTHIV